MGILAGDVAAPDQVEVDVVVRREAQSDLGSRFTDGIGRRRLVFSHRRQPAGYPIDFADQSERLDEIPFETRAPGRVMDFVRAISVRWKSWQRFCKSFSCTRRASGGRNYCGRS